MDPDTRNGAKSGETAHLLLRSGGTATPTPVIRRGSAAANRTVKNGGSRQGGPQPRPPPF